MGIWDEYCIICGGPIHIYEEGYRNKPYFSWLKHLFGLGHYGRIHNDQDQTNVLTN
jgi:hypothetical protein